MGFFKKLFKRKKGGTMFGNLLRGVVNQASGGVLGNGQDLAKWEAQQNQKDYAKAQQIAAQQAAQAQQVGKVLVPDSVTKNVDAAHGKMSMAYVKKHWYYFLGGLVALIGVIWYVAKPKNNRKSSKRR